MKMIFKELSFFFKKHKWRYLIAVVSMIISSLAMMLPAKIIGRMIDTIVNGQLTYARLGQLVLVFILAIVATYIFEVIWTYFIFVGSYHIEGIFQKKMMHNFLMKRSGFYHKFRTGDLVTRASEDIRTLGMTTGFGVYAMIFSFMMLIVILLTMAMTISWRLTLVAMLPAPILGFFVARLGSKVDAEFTDAQKAVSDLNNDVLEVIDGTYVVRAYGQEEAVIERFKQDSQKAAIQNIRVAKLNTAFMPLCGLAMIMSFALGFLYGGILIERGVIEVGDMVSFQVYIGMTIWPVVLTGQVVTVVEQGKASLKRIKEVLTASDDLEVCGSKVLESVQSIVFKNFDFSYPGSTELALKDINLEIYAGQTIGVVGKTGSGKTTFIRQFIHQYPYNGEQFLMNGELVTEYTMPSYLERVAYVPQEHTLFSRSIRENLYLGKDQVSDYELYEALALASFEDDVKAMPKQLDTLVGEKGISLSGGQKQRLSIARAFLRDSEILLLDDALSAVDAKTEREIIEHIERERRGRTNIITSHRLSSICSADKIIVLDEGQIVDCGTHEELLSHKGWYYEQYLRQEMEGR